MTAILDAIDTSQILSLLHMNGADGAPTFTDATGLTWSAVGDAQLDTAQKKFGSASLLLDGALVYDYIQSENTTRFAFSVNDFTIDAWVRLPNSTGGLYSIFGGSTNGDIHFAINTTALILSLGGVGTQISRVHGIANNTWAHVAVSRKDNFLRLFVDGVQLGAAVADATNYKCTTYAQIGAFTGLYVFPGWIDEFRVSRVGYSSITLPTAEYADPLTQIASQRQQKRWKDYFVAIPGQNSIVTARVNGTFATTDGIEQIPFDGVTGTIANAKMGMECWIGSAAGLSDIGVVRLAEDATVTPFRIGKVSGIAIDDNQYLTVVDNYPLAARPSLVTPDDERVDGWIEYDPRQSLAPLVNIGPMARVLTLTGTSVSTTFAAPTIYSPSGATVAAYLWSCTGASATSGLTTATPLFIFNAAGKYVVNLQLTDSAGGVTTVHRLILVNPTTTTCADLQLRGDIDSGGWECSFEGLDGVNLTELRDGAQIVLYRKDYVGTAEASSLGEYSGCENVRFVGWIDGQSISINPDYGTVSFVAYGPAWWLDETSSPGVVIQDGTTQAWHHYATLNADKALYRLARWQSTLYSICDVNLSGSTDRIYTCNAEPGSTWAQMVDIASRKLFANVWADNLGCVWVRVPPSLLDSTDKAALPVLFACLEPDIDGEVDFDRVKVNPDGLVEIGCIAYNGTSERAFFSRAPGNTATPHGAIDAPATELAITTQAEVNRLTGDYFAMMNAEFPAVEFYLGWALDWPDFLRWIITLTIPSSATPRGIAAWAAKRFYPVSIELSFDAETGSEYTTLTLAEETDGADGITYIPPQADGVDDWKLPSFSAGDFDLVPLGDWLPDIIPPIVDDVGDCSTAPGNAYRLTWSGSKLTGIGGPFISRAYFPCTLRPSAYAEGPTQVTVEVTIIGDAASHLTMYAIDGSGTRLITGTSLAYDGVKYLTVNFAPVTPLAVAGFELELDEGPSEDGAQAALGVGSANYVEYLDGGGTNSYTATFANVAYGIIKWDWVTSFNESNILFNNAIQQQVGYTTDTTAYIYATVFFAPVDAGTAKGYVGLGRSNTLIPADYREGVVPGPFRWTVGLCNGVDALQTFTSISYQYGWIGGTGTATGLHTSVAAVYISTMNIERTVFLLNSLVYDVCP